MFHDPIGAVLTADSINFAHKVVGAAFWAFVVAVFVGFDLDVIAVAEWVRYFFSSLSEPF
jgi:hypothetical protein